MAKKKYAPSEKTKKVVFFIDFIIFTFFKSIFNNHKKYYCIYCYCYYYYNVW